MPAAPAAGTTAAPAHTAQQAAAMTCTHNRVHSHGVELHAGAQGDGGEHLLDAVAAGNKVVELKLVGS